MNSHELAKKLLLEPAYSMLTYDPYTAQYEEIDTFIVDHDEKDITVYSDSAFLIRGH